MNRPNRYSSCAQAMFVCSAYTQPHLLQLQVQIGGYSQAVAQPARGGELYKAGDAALVLSDAELTALGWRAAKLQRALLIEGALVLIRRHTLFESTVCIQAAIQPQLDVARVTVLFKLVDQLSSRAKVTVWFEFSLAIVVTLQAAMLSVSSIMLQEFCDALNVADRPTRVQALKALGVKTGTKQEAEEELTLLGRSGQLPWILDHIRNTLTYLSPSGLIVVPPAHNLLHGLTANLVVFAVKTTSTDAPRPELFSRNPVLLDFAARDFVKVRSQHPHYRLCPTLFCLCNAYTASSPWCLCSAVYTLKYVHGMRSSGIVHTVLYRAPRAQIRHNVVHPSAIA
jgi:hypothetical protein